MKRKQLYIFILLFLCYIVVLIPYFYMFNTYLSETSADWSHFGGYIGGLLAPLFSFIAVIFLIKSHYNTIEQNIKKDKLEMIYRLEDNIQYKLNEKVFLLNQNSEQDNKELTLNMILHPILGEKFKSDQIWEYILDRYYDIMIDFNELKHLLDDYFNYTSDQWITNSIIVKYIIPVTMIKELLKKCRDKIDKNIYVKNEQ